MAETSPFAFDEEKLLQEDSNIAKLTQRQRDVFDRWAGPKNPSIDRAENWLRKNIDPQVGISSFRAKKRLIKLAVWKWASQRYKEILGENLPVMRPGFGLPLSYMTDRDIGDEGVWKAATLLNREACMLKFLNELSDKPEWWKKVKNDEIAAKWKKEALETNWASYLKHADFTPAMADACISELRKKASIYEQTGFITVYDYSAAVVKSDRIMTTELAKSLQDAIRPLEDIPAGRKDWQPNSDEQVFNLVHPSLWPLIYGRTKVLTDRVIGVEDCLAHCGMGTVLPKPLQTELETCRIGKTFRRNDDDTRIVALSKKFQWLPCDVCLDSATGNARIASYINNLHPKQHANMYPIIARFIEKSLPAWDIIYNWEKHFSVQRLKTMDVREICPCPEVCRRRMCNPWNRPINNSESPRGKREWRRPEYKKSDRKKLDEAWFSSTHSLKVPDADAEAEQYVRLRASDIKSSGFFGGKKEIQVIVKLANIHLTPEKPKYSGGSWHVEGQQNEHIVSTALYYYDADNITDNTLDFRTCADRENLSEELHYEQYDHKSIEQTFAISTSGVILQDIGTVYQLSSLQIRQDQAIGTLQADMDTKARDSPTGEEEDENPGLESMVERLPLKDAKGWQAKEEARSQEWPIGEEQAKRLRLELMAERTQLKETADSKLREMKWSFCEH